MKDYILPSIIAIIGSSGLFTFITFIINRRDGKSDALHRIESALTSIKRDSTRTQLLMMIADYPDNIEEILTLGERYFVELGGNWYMSTIFSKWLTSKDLPKPDWYRH